MPFISRWRQDEYPATDQTQCVSIYIPEGDEFKAVLAALLSLPTSTDNYADPASAAADGLAAVWDEAYALNNWEGCGEPPECVSMDSNFTLLPYSMLVGSGNPIVFTADTAQNGNGFMLQNPPINGNYIYTSRMLEAGAWNYSILCRTNTTSAKFRCTFLPLTGSTVTIDHDFYSAVDTKNARFTGSFTLPTRGLWAIRITANGKNASSSNYQLFITSIVFWRDA